MRTCKRITFALRDASPRRPLLNARNVQVVKVAEEGVTGVFGVRVKGIYSTALTELLVENGVTVVDASPQLKARFGDSVSSRGVALATIKDREDRRGVVILGRKARALWKELLRFSGTHCSYLPSQ